MSRARSFAVIATLLVAMGVFAATAAAVETLWKWLPGAENTALSVETAKITFQINGGSSITCEKTTTTAGELTKESTLATASLSMGKCTSLGLPVENEGGGGAGMISFSVELHNCLIKAGDAGVSIKLAKEVKLEIPALGTKLSLRGSAIGLVSPNKSLKKAFTLTLAQAAGKQAIEKCEGGVAQKLETSTKGGAFIQTGVEAKSAEIRFPVVEQEIFV
jgi:hypothetical protein